MEFSMVTDIDVTQRPFKVTIDGSIEETAESVIISTGASAKWIGLESEQKLMGYGVSACATCDGAFFKDKPIAVVGGGDTAMEEAVFLTRYGSEVVVIHRRDTLRASKIMQERAQRNPKIRFIWDTEVTDILTETGKEVTGLKLRNRKTGEENTLDTSALFVAIGHKPNTDVFTDKIQLDDNGYIELLDQTRTNVEGIFAAGDVADTRYRQAITAAGMGCMAAMDAEKWLEEQEEA